MGLRGREVIKQAKAGPVPLSVEMAFLAQWSFRMSRAHVGRDVVLENCIRLTFPITTPLCLERPVGPVIMLRIPYARQSFLGLLYEETSALGWKHSDCSPR